MASSVNNKRPASAFLDEEFPVVFKRERRAYSLTIHDAEVVKGWSQQLQREWSSSSLSALYQRSIVREEEIPRFRNLRVTITPTPAPAPLPSPLHEVIPRVIEGPRVRRFVGDGIAVQGDGRVVRIDLVFRSFEDRESFEKSASDDLRALCALTPSLFFPSIRFSCPYESCEEMIMGISDHFPELIEYLNEKIDELLDPA